jgi:NADH dehydrogenase [ubiquinone] 1 alpha subcomplex assembly factor 5
MILRAGTQPLRHAYRRTMASTSGGPVNPHTVGPFRVFDRAAKASQKDRSAVVEGGARSRTVDYVREEVADRLLERLMVRRRGRAKVCTLNMRAGHQAQVQHHPRLGRRARTPDKAHRAPDGHEGRHARLER